MTYRDDRDADQARIAALEGELAAARGRIDELEGKRSQALVLASRRDLQTTGKKSAAARWFGAPLHLELSRRFDGAYPVEKLEDLVEVIRTMTRDRGRTELLRSSVAWSSSGPERGIGPHLNVTVSSKQNVTTLTVTDRLGNLAGGLYGGVGGGVGGGLIFAPLAATFVVPVLAPMFFIGWFAGVYAGTRALFKRSARKRAEALQQLYDALAAEIVRELGTR